MNVSLKLCLYALTILLHFTEFTGGNVGIDDEFILVDGIRVRKSDQMNTRFEQQKKKKQASIQNNLDEEEARLYNESTEITKDLPTKCQGLSFVNISSFTFMRTC